MSRRSQLFEEICSLADNESLEIIDPDSGWPGTAILHQSDREIPVALHVSKVSSHARADYELRFQNPADGSVVANPNNSLPLLLGLYDSSQEKLIVGTTGHSRLGRDARFSLLFHKRIVDTAKSFGWGVYVSNSGESIFAFHPLLLSNFIEMMADGAITTRDTESIQSIISASGLLDDATAKAKTRLRKSINVLVRNRSFSTKVRDAYEHACAMCGIQLCHHRCESVLIPPV